MSLLPAPVSLPKAETKASSSPIQTPETPVRYENETYFLVRASHQLDAAPAWVKYKEFDSAASFLTQMGQECGLPTWRSANAQLAAELEGSPPLAGVMASVKLEWTDDEVLVRWGRDSDLEIIAGQVRRAWLAKDLGFRCIQCFKIAVLLHVRDWE
ncbi:hypothetical protein AOCH_005231 [Aspergillus ochraceoroseus]|uniref:Uncharacterized protein n=1 Tax=Aspergillus ochraceoroseus TaxID=138278 RepID=A0A0F8URN5_9EURO|nr:hypothetical protein AOCH_005231 [Aspergillus ochraceoroseus]